MHLSNWRRDARRHENESCSAGRSIVSRSPASVTLDRHPSKASVHAVQVRFRVHGSRSQSSKSPRRGVDSTRNGSQEAIVASLRTPDLKAQDYTPSRSGFPRCGAGFPTVRVHRRQVPVATHRLEFAEVRARLWQRKDRPALCARTSARVVPESAVVGHSFQPWRTATLLREKSRMPCRRGSVCLPVACVVRPRILVLVRPLRQRQAAAFVATGSSECCKSRVEARTTQGCQEFPRPVRD